MVPGMVYGDGDGDGGPDRWARGHARSSDRHRRPLALAGWLAGSVTAAHPARPSSTVLYCTTVTRVHACIHIVACLPSLPGASPPLGLRSRWWALGTGHRTLDTGHWTLDSSAPAMLGAGRGGGARVCVCVRGCRRGWMWPLLLPLPAGPTCHAREARKSKPYCATDKARGRDGWMEEGEGGGKGREVDQDRRAGRRADTRKDRTRPDQTRPDPSTPPDCATQPAIIIHPPSRPRASQLASLLAHAPSPRIELRSLRRPVSQSVFLPRLCRNRTATPGVDTRACTFLPGFRPLFTLFTPPLCRLRPWQQGSSSS